MEYANSLCFNYEVREVKTYNPSKLRHIARLSSHLNVS